jgi:hypothetical protein
MFIFTLDGSYSMGSLQTGQYSIKRLDSDRDKQHFWQIECEHGGNIIGIL